MLEDMINKFDDFIKDIFLKQVILMISRANLSKIQII